MTNTLDKQGKLSTADMATAGRTPPPPEPLPESLQANGPVETQPAAERRQPPAEPDSRAVESRPAADGDRTKPLPSGAVDDKLVTLLDDDTARALRARWLEVQTGFVDEPRTAVEQADNLVAEVMQQLAQKFSNARSQLEQQWGRGSDVSTEELRLTLQQYRSFFDRLLSF